MAHCSGTDESETMWQCVHPEHKTCKQHCLLGASGKTVNAVVSKEHLTGLLLSSQSYILGSEVDHNLSDGAGSQS